MEYLRQYIPNGSVVGKLFVRFSCHRCYILSYHINMSIHMSYMICRHMIHRHMYMHIYDMHPHMPANP